MPRVKRYARGPKKEKPEMSLLNLKITAVDKRRINANARRYAGGNLSAWLRHAGIAFKPGKLR